MATKARNKFASDPEARAAKIEKAKEQLIAGVKAIKTGDEWKAMLSRMAVAGKLSPARLSFNNQILLWAQGSTGRVATYQAWLKFGRQVRKGEKSLVILAPCPFKKADGKGGETKGIFFRALAVFAEAQTDVTDASKIPADAVLPRIADQATFEHTTEELREFALTLPDVSAITLRERTPEDISAEGWCVVKTGEIVVLTTGKTHAEIFSMLAHEIAHACMHKWGEHHTRSAAEVEAESVSFIVCHALGLDTSAAAFPYVATWAGKLEDPTKAVLASGKRIADAAHKILSCLAGESEAEESEPSEMSEAAE